MQIENKAKKDWFLDRKWGMFNHFINFESNNSRTCYRSYKDFNERVNSFDVENYAKIAHEVNAGYVIFTLAQAMRFMCAPNDTFNKITGYKPGEACSERDLISDLIDALGKYDIPLLVYWSAEGTYLDKEAGAKFDYNDRETQAVHPEFIKKWVSVLEEYALRYGNRIHGWWIDGAHDYIGYMDKDDEFLKPYYDVIKKGNPEALIAFNNGVRQLDLKNPAYKKFYDGETHYMKQIRKLEKAASEGNEEARKAFDRIPGNSYRYSKYEDYTAGEANEFKELPKTRFVDGSQWHLLSFLGIENFDGGLWGRVGWNSVGCRYSADYMYEYVKKCNSLGGVVSIETGLFDDGHIDWGQYEILKKLGELRK